MPTARYEEHDTVVLLHDIAEAGGGLRAGDLGTVVHVYSRDALEIEFATASGRLQALVTLSERDVRHVTDEDLLAVRARGARGTGGPGGG